MSRWLELDGGDASATVTADGDGMEVEDQQPHLMERIRPAPSFMERRMTFEDESIPAPLAIMGGPFMGNSGDREYYAAGSEGGAANHSGSGGLMLRADDDYYDNEYGGIPVGFAPISDSTPLFVPSSLMLYGTLSSDIVLADWVAFLVPKQWDG